MSWWICFLQARSFVFTRWYNGLKWCGLLWCFYQLFGLSFWRHPFTADDPLMSKWWNATFLQIWWRNKLIYILDDLRVRTFSAKCLVICESEERDVLRLNFRVPYFLSIYTQWRFKADFLWAAGCFFFFFFTRPFFRLLFCELKWQFTQNWHFYDHLFTLV